MGGDGRKVCSMILTSAWRFILIIFFFKNNLYLPFLFVLSFFFFNFWKETGPLSNNR